MKTIKVALGLLAVTAAITAEAAVYRAGFRQGRFWLNDSKTVPSFDQDTYSANSWDWTLSALMCNVTGNAGAKGYSEVSGNEWQWQNYYGYAYDGEMWMTAGTTYTFGGNFDDGSAILVDGAVVWSQGNPGGTASGYNNWVAPRTFTPGTTGWHPVKLLVWDWEGGKNITSGALSATMWNTNGTITAAPTSDWNKFVDDGSGSLFRAKLAESYISVTSIRQTTDGYAVTVASSAPSAVTMTLYADAADKGETDAGWAAQSQPVPFAANESSEIAFAWSDSAIPTFRIHLTGTDPTLAHYGDFWEWTKASRCTMEPTVSAALSSISGSSGTFTVTLGYDKTVEGVTPPAITLKAFYGATDAGATATGWDADTDFSSATAAGTHSCILENLQQGASYCVRFAAKTADSDWVWSDAVPFSLAGVYLDAVPARVYESDVTEQSFKVCRPAAGAAEAVTVALSYSGSSAIAKVSALPATVTLAAGVAEVAVPFTLVDNDLSDGDQTLTVQIVASADYLSGDPASAVITIVDDETAATVCEWTGAGDGQSWSDAENWSTHAVPTQIDTALFGENVTANLTVTMASDATARLVRFESAAEVKLGAAATPAFDAMDMAVAEGAGIVRIASNLAFDKEATFSVATNATLALAYVGGTADLVKEGPGRIVLSGNNNSSGRTAGATIVKASRLEFASTGKLLGRQLVVGGFGEPAVAYATYVSQWNWNPMSGDYVGVFEVGDMGVLDLSANQNSVQLQSMSRFTVSKGGTLKVGKTRLLTTGADTIHFFLEGSVESTANGELNMANSGRLVIPETRDDMLVFDGGIRCKGDYYSGGAYEGGTAWGNRYPRIFVADIPGAPVDFVLNGHVYGQGDGDGFDKRDPGVMRMTASNTYGGRSSSEGMTRVHGGTLLVDNVEGSATGKSRVEVAKGTTLGGTGRVGGIAGANNSALVVSGADGNPATVRPGTIADATGAFIAGTLTAGSTNQVCPTTFGDYSELKISLTPAGASSLAVFGAVTVSSTGTKLTLEAAGCTPDRVKGGRFRILSATGGITGDFAALERPRPGWKVIPVMATREVEGGEGETVAEEYVAAFDLDIIKGTYILVR